MKKKIYTLGHDIDLLKQIDNDGGQFTAEEHAFAIEKQFGDSVYKEKGTLLGHYLPENLTKLGALSIFIDSVKNNGYRNILSLGAGSCVLEYLLQLSLGEVSKIVACDFNRFFIERAKKFFPEIIAEQFDFFKDDIESFKTALNIDFDVAVFFGSAYVMDDVNFVKLFSGLKRIGVDKIFDFHAGYMDINHLVFNCIKSFTGENIMRKLHRRPTELSEGYRGKFHGYSRSRGELRRLYTESGLQIHQESSTFGYKYVAIVG